MTSKNLNRICQLSVLLIIAQQATVRTCCAQASLPAAGSQAAETKNVEGELGPFLTDPSLEMTQLFTGERFPNVVVAMDGSVVATWGSSKIRVRRSDSAGESWGQESTVADPGFQGGGLTVDESTGRIFMFVESQHPPAKIQIYATDDHGQHWSRASTSIAADRHGNDPSMHMNEHGITLRHGTYAGRLIRPSRWYAGQNAREKWPEHYTNAIYSDDGGATWKTSDPFTENGTGEAAIVELSDGKLLYNSRRHWADEGEDPRRRWLAHSDDGGVTWSKATVCEALPDGPQDSDYGCMAGMIRLPVKGRDILLYSNCDSPRGRKHGTVWASFDGGRTWPLKREVTAGAFAYSSMAAGRPDTDSEGWVFLLFEGGPKGGGTIARFNLSWLLEGKVTGELPAWLRKTRNHPL